MLKEVKGRIMMEKEVMENTVMETTQLRSEQELDDVKITIQVDVHHALEITKENPHNNVNEDTTVVCEIKNDDAMSVDAKEKDSKCVMEKGNKELTMMEKYNILMKEKRMVEDNKDVCEMKEDTKSAGEKERDSACVMEQRKNDLTMMGNEKESRCVTENGNNELTTMEKDNIAMKEEGHIKHNQDTIMENVMDNDKSELSDTLASHTVLDAPIMDRVTDTLLNSTPTTSTSLEVWKVK